MAAALRIGAAIVLIWVCHRSALSAAARFIDALPVPLSSGISPSGTLTDAVWTTAMAAADFIQREPKEGAQPSQQTEFRVAYDATTLYVKVRAFDTEPDRIVTYLTRRDDESPCDWIRVFVDSYHDRRTAYEFAVNPSGVKQDRYWFNDTNRDDSWDAVWDAHVSRDQQGWLAEFRIPFSQLRFAQRESAMFGFAVVREIGRLKETSSWPLLPRSATGFVSSFGDVGGLSATRSPKRLEVVPYAVGGLTKQPTNGSPLLKASAGDLAVGLDLKYALTSGLTLTTTINPDFGQVEADPAVVNLSAFETFFSERRPFFVEGSGNFNFGLDCSDGQCNGLFYSRRIGRPPQGVADLPSGDQVYVDSPAQTTILGAAKVTGRVGRFSIGALHAVTGTERSTVFDGATTFTRPVEPLTQYSLARVVRQFTNQSSVGFMLTGTARHAADLGPPLPSSAITGGFDVDWRFRSRYSVAGYWAGSRLRGAADAIARIQQDSRHAFQRPDAGAARLDERQTTLAGSAARIAIRKIGGERVRFESSAAFKSPGFDVNDLGFFQRADMKSMSNWLQVRSDRPTRWFRNRSINFNQYAQWNYDGDVLGSGGNVNAHVVFANSWSTGGGFNFNRRSYDDRLSRGGPGGLVEGNVSGWHYVNSDDRRRVSLNYSGNFGTDGHGSSSLEFEPRVVARPAPALSIVAGARIANNTVDSQWIENAAVAGAVDAGERAMFGRLQQTTVSFTGRVNYTLRPTLSLQLYAEPFVSAGGYGAFKALVDGRHPDYSQRYAPTAFPDGDPDFNYRSFRTTNVLRWEYKPGSTLFVVWQQAREDSVTDGRFRFASDFHGLFTVPARNTFLVKMTYWLNY